MDDRKCYRLNRSFLRYRPFSQDRPLMSIPLKIRVQDSKEVSWWFQSEILSAGMFRMRPDSDLKIRHTWSLKTKSSNLSSIIGYKECSQFWADTLLIGSQLLDTFCTVGDLAALSRIPFVRFGLDRFGPVDPWYKPISCSYRAEEFWGYTGSHDVSNHLRTTWYFFDDGGEASLEVLKTRNRWIYLIRLESP